MEMNRITWIFGITTGISITKKSLHADPDTPYKNSTTTIIVTTHTGVKKNTKSKLKYTIALPSTACTTANIVCVAGADNAASHSS